MHPRTHSRTGLLGFFAAIAGIATAYGSAFLPGGPPAFAPWLMAFGTALSMVSAMVIGASRPGRPLGALGWVFAGTMVLITGGFWLALGMTPESGGERIVLGLPQRAAILIYGIGLLPVFVLPIAYAMTFERLTLSEADLRRFRERIAEIRAQALPAAASGSAVPPLPPLPPSPSRPSPP